MLLGSINLKGEIISFTICHFLSCLLILSQEIVIEGSIQLHFFFENALEKDEFFSLYTRGGGLVCNIKIQYNKNRYDDTVHYTLCIIQLYRDNLSYQILITFSDENFSELQYLCLCHGFTLRKISLSNIFAPLCEVTLVNSFLRLTKKKKESEKDMEFLLLLAGVSRWRRRSRKEAKSFLHLLINNCRHIYICVYTNK